MERESLLTKYTDGTSKAVLPAENGHVLDLSGYFSGDEEPADCSIVCDTLDELLYCELQSSLLGVPAFPTPNDLRDVDISDPFSQRVMQIAAERATKSG